MGVVGLLAASGKGQARQKEETSDSGSDLSVKVFA
jgi:hypothetical protein